MTLEEIKNRAMFQTNNDIDDLEEYMPYLVQYINEGYDLLVLAFTDEHLPEESLFTEDSSDDETPEAVPVWAHPAVADYATWMIYRNSNPTKQQRGMQFLAAFQQTAARLKALAAKGARFHHWR